MCDDSVNIFPPHSSFKESFIFKATYPVYCDIVIHKYFFIAAIITTSSDIQPNYSLKRFSTFNNNTFCFIDWLDKYKRRGKNELLLLLQE